MLTRIPPNRRTPLLSAITLLALAASTTMLGTVLGCKSNQPASPAGEAPAARQPVTPVPAVKKHLYSAEADPKAEIAAALRDHGGRTLCRLDAAVGRSRGLVPIISGGGGGGGGAAFNGGTITNPLTIKPVVAAGSDLLVVHNDAGGAGSSPLTVTRTPGASSWAS